MTDTIKLIAGTSHPAFAAEIAAKLGMPLCDTEILRFGNENILFQCKENVREADVFVVQTSCPPATRCPAPAAWRELRGYGRSATHASRESSPSAWTVGPSSTL